MRRCALLAFLLLCTGASAFAQTTAEALKRLSLEDLLNLEPEERARKGLFMR